MQGTRATYEVTVGDIVALRGYVAELAGPEDADAAERLLGQLAALQQHRDGDGGTEATAGGEASGRDRMLRFTPVLAAQGLAARAMDALRGEGDVRMGSRRWRLHRPRRSSASKRRLAPGSSPGDGAS